MMKTPLGRPRAKLVVYPGRFSGETDPRFSFPRGQV